MAKTPLAVVIVCRVFSRFVSHGVDLFNETHGDSVQHFVPFHIQQFSNIRATVVSQRCSIFSRIKPQVRNPALTFRVLLSLRSTSEPEATTAIDQFDSYAGDSDQQTTHYEAFEYQDLADVAKTVKNAFDDLTGVSPLWFSVEKDAGGDTRRRPCGGKRGGGRTGRGDVAGYEMFGDWRVEESLVDVFENQPQVRSDKQVLKRSIMTDPT